ncbi:ABC exporter membrane fusion protein [Aliterella atlantica]|uniref:ABC transporter permease n=1 Tax=Aliterella atlantica CENA595 TaxID=1618023 RepID=A0A0D9A0I7_9CYAN|nr:ABC exporter membrane fusion protein [Aliterella atlantica]KJH72986.1 ABC transporter permease [Aliterella atlantica CENA595]
MKAVLPKTLNRRLVGLVLAAIGATSAIAYYGISQSGLLTQPATEPVATPPPVKKVTALGRLEPEAEIISLAAPVDLDGDRLAQLLVAEGDIVKQGQVVAILDAQGRLQDELLQAQEQVKNARAKLNQVKAGAKSGEIQAQQATIVQLEAELSGSRETQNATIARWQSEVRTAQAEYNRFVQLYRQGAIAASNLDTKRLAAETAAAQLQEALAAKNRNLDSLQAQINAAKATLNRIAEVRPVDVETAQTEVDSAIASVKRAQTSLDRAYIRAPIAGQILKIHTRPGEKLSDDGIVDMGKTDRMIAVAEVYQTDIGKVQVGQQAIITSQAFDGEIKGKVAQIGMQVERQKVFSNQPGENLDRRVVEVKILLNPEGSKKVAGLTNLQVQTAINL